MKRLLIGLIALAAIAAPNWARAMCTTVTVTTASTMVLKANDTGSNGRHLLYICNNGPVEIAYCDVGNSSGATAAQGYAIWPSAGNVPGQNCLNIPATQQSTRTFPFAPSGEVDCITPTGTASVSACDQ